MHNMANTLTYADNSVRLHDMTLSDADRRPFVRDSSTSPRRRTLPATRGGPGTALVSQPGPLIHSISARRRGQTTGIIRFHRRSGRGSRPVVAAGSAVGPSRHRCCMEAHSQQTRPWTSRRRCCCMQDWMIGGTLILGRAPVHSATYSQRCGWG